MKECRKCTEVKELSSFYKDKTKKDGHHTICIACRKKDRKIRYSLTREDSIKAATEWGKNNKEKKNKSNKKWGKRNQNYKNYHTALYRAQKLKATPKWADLEYIKSYYKISQFLTEHTDEEYHVDHIAPLLGKSICGLHCTENLQVVPAVWNLKKGNRNMEVYE